MFNYKINYFWNTLLFNNAIIREKKWILEALSHATCRASMSITNHKEVIQDFCCFDVEQATSGDKKSNPSILVFRKKMKKHILLFTLFDYTLDNCCYYY